MRIGGSEQSVAYGTMISDRSSVSAYGNLGFDVSDKAQFFTDVQFSWSRLKLFRDVLDWFYVAPDGNARSSLPSIQVGSSSGLPPNAFW